MKQFIVQMVAMTIALVSADTLEDGEEFSFEDDDCDEDEFGRDDDCEDDGEDDDEDDCEDDDEDDCEDDDEDDCEDDQE